MINCDTDNDEYFENHYQFCHGILNTPLSTDTDYEHRRVLLTVDGEYYARCKSRTPLSLRILSCNEILKHKEITMVGASFLPRELMTLLKEVGLNIQKKDDWDVIKSSMSVLLEYWPYKVLHLEARSHKRWFQLALTHLVLDRFAAEIDSDALQKPCRNQLTEFVMKDSVQSVLFSVFNQCFCLEFRKKNSTLMYMARINDVTEQDNSRTTCTECRSSKITLTGLITGQTRKILFDSGEVSLAVIATYNANCFQLCAVIKEDGSLIILDQQGSIIEFRDNKRPSFSRNWHRNYRFHDNSSTDISSTTLRLQTFR